ncbi:MAG: hypothetical protein AB7F59_01850 [Bdellovibrionales bacterium]
MKIILSFLILVTAIVSQASGVESIQCKNERIEIAFQLQYDESVGSISLKNLTTQDALSLDLKLDPVSEKSPYNVYSQRDIAATQRSYNSTLVLRIPKTRNATFKASLEDRDYDDDYESGYRLQDKGPDYNGYVLRSGWSDIEISCTSSH